MSWTTEPPLVDGWTDEKELDLGDIKYTELGTLTYSTTTLSYNSVSNWGFEPGVVQPWD